jgi:hypothetical protein
VPRNKPDLAVVKKPSAPLKADLPKAITRKGLATFIEKCLAAYAPDTVPRLMEAVRQGAIRGDKDLIDKGLKVFGLIHSGSGVAVNIMNNNTANANANATAVQSRGFDAIMRNLAQKDQVIDTTAE